MKEDRRKRMCEKNNKRHFFNALISVFLFFFFLSFTSHVPRLTSYVLFSPNTANAASPTQVCFKTHCFNIETVDNDLTRARGLQGRAYLKVDEGMLFVFDHEDTYNFWMKDTLIPLDMIWIDHAQQVVDVKSNVPPCREETCPIYSPVAQGLYVLEINAGAAKAQGIRVGDKADFK